MACRSVNVRPHIRRLKQLGNLRRLTLRWYVPLNLIYLKLGKPMSHRKTFSGKPMSGVDLLILILNQVLFERPFGLKTAAHVSVARLGFIEQSVSIPEHQVGLGEKVQQ